MHIYRIGVIPAFFEACIQYVCNMYSSMFEILRKLIISTGLYNLSYITVLNPSWNTFLVLGNSYACLLKVEPVGCDIGEGQIIK